MSGKILVSRRRILKAVAAVTVAELLAACGLRPTAEPTLADSATPTTEPTKIPTPISTAQKRATPTPEATSTPPGPVIVVVPQPQPEIQSVIKGLNIGQVTPKNIVGMVPGNETPINTLYSPDDQPVVTKTQDGDREVIPARAFGIDQEFLKQYFQASTDQGSGITTGTTPEGVSVTLNNGIWTAAAGETFIPFIKAEPGSDSVYLVISADGLLQEVDIDGKSVGEPHPMFETPSDIARRMQKKNPENATLKKVDPDSVVAVKMNPEGSLSFISQGSRPTESNPDRIVQVVNEVDFLAPAEELTKNATAKAAIDAFAGALIVAGVVITAEYLHKKSFTVMRVDGPDKISYNIATVAIEDGTIGGCYPLMIKTEEKEWESRSTVANLFLINGVLFGFPYDMKGNLYRKIIRPPDDLVGESSHISTPGDSFYQGFIFNGDRIDWIKVDDYLAFIKKYGLVAGAPHLYWAGNTYTPQNETLLNERALKIVEHCKELIHEWTINELFNDDGTPKDINTIKTAISVILTIRSIDPSAKIIINDFGMDWTTNKDNACFEFVKQLMADNILNKGDLIGYQGHNGVEYSKSATQFADWFSRYAELGLGLRITEADVFDVKSITQANEVKKASIILMYYRAGQILETKYGRKILDAIIIWGSTNSSSWLRDIGKTGEYPVLLDDNGNPYLSWYLIAQALLNDISVK